MAPNSKIQAITFLASIFDLRGCVDLGFRDRARYFYYRGKSD
eukprot:COSAG01_NODE_78192_length_150_cov_25.313725_1_plen_41_part_01